MIVIFGGIKGGTGKTTLSTNLAVLRANQSKNKVLLIDGDHQLSTRDWADQRFCTLGAATEHLITIPMFGKEIFEHLKKSKDAFDDIIVDCGGRDTEFQRAAILSADVFVVPFKPRSMDIWTAHEMASTIKEAQTLNPKLRPYFVINQADSKGLDNEDAIKFLQETKIPCLYQTIGNRKCFPNASAMGLGIIELKKKDKHAISELMELHDLIYK